MPRGWSLEATQFLRDASNLLHTHPKAALCPPETQQTDRQRREQREMKRGEGQSRSERGRGPGS